MSTEVALPTASPTEEEVVVDEGLIADTMSKLALTKKKAKGKRVVSGAAPFPL